MEPLVKNILALAASGTVVLSIIGYMVRTVISQISEMRQEAREYNLQIRQFEHEIRFGWVYQKRMEIIERIYNDLKSIIHYIVLCRDSLYPVAGTQVSDITFEDIQDKNDEMERYIEEKSLYFSPELITEFQESIASFRKASESIGIEQILRKKDRNEELNHREMMLYNIMYMNRLAGGMAGEQIQAELKESSHENIQRALFHSENAISSLEKEFKKIIGI